MRLALFALSCCLLFLLMPGAFAQRPELGVQLGHAEAIFGMAISPDGKTLASVDWDSTAKLWDINTGTELRTLQCPGGGLAFSPDGKILACGGTDGEDNTIKLWDVNTGQELRTLRDASFSSGNLIFSPDGKSLFSTGDSISKNGGSAFRVWDIATGRVLRRLLLGGDKVVSKPFRLADNSWVVAVFGANRGTAIGLVDISTATVVRTQRANFTTPEVRSLFKPRDFFVNHVPVTEERPPFTLSPDGKTLAVATAAHTIGLWDVGTGQLIRTLSGHSQRIASLTFSPDGHILASGGDDTKLKLWDTATGANLRTLGETYGRLVEFSRDGQTLAVSSSNSSINLWDVNSGTKLRVLKKHAYAINAVTVSRDGKTFAGAGDGSLNLWNLATGTVTNTFPVYSRVNALAFRPDGNLLASGTDDYVVTLWDIATGAPPRKLKRHTGGINSVAFSPDGLTLASGSSDQTIKLWDVKTGTERRTLEGHNGFVLSVAFSPDGTTLASGGEDNTLKLWDAGTGKLLRTLSGHTAAVQAVAFSPDGKTLASGSVDHTIKLWSVATGRVIRSLNGQGDVVLSIAFSPDGQTLASGHIDATIKLWDMHTYAELRALRGHEQSVRSNAFSGDGQILISGSEDGKIKLWQIGSGAELASLIALDQQDWAIVAPDGLFDGSPAAWHLLIWRFAGRTFDYAPIEAFFNEFYYPGLLADIFAGRQPKAPQDISRKDRRQPQIKLALAATNAPGPIINTRDVPLQIEIDNAPAGAQDVRLFRNGSLVKVWHGDVLQGQPSVTLDASVVLTAGANELTAYAFNRDNVKSTDARLTVVGGNALTRTSTAYILAVGVNHYANPAYDLKYAAADAQTFSTELQRQQEALRRYGRVEVVTLLDQAATKANILHALAGLAERAQPEDTVTIYFAGHGTAQRNQFYLIPHDLGYTGARTQLDEAGLQTILAHSLSDRELAQAYEHMDAGQLMLVIDACNSGQALEAEEKRRGPMNSKGLAQLAYEKGMYILTAAESFQAAQEASQLGHGLLTYALVEEGLKQALADDEPRDGQVVVREWLDYATKRVPAMQLDKMQAARGLGLDLSFREEERDLGVARRVGQHPRVFYRRELEARPFVVARH